ncbi:UNVERIFIED_CONTAM: Cytochrome c biogenesis CcmF N-terminal-like mitochondrial protein 1 [Sesamum calycinum]|uniref:Cytochrome c biogenesis CcmF N-terminal-like mitochondrial protein 1 n=1 Tax=Sesamum calycinum TaxID=2727403 RepID=A0AAW2JUC4_9LAMI
MSFAPMGARRSRGSREGKRTHPLLHLARDDKERASFIDEQRIDGALGIALFFSPFLSASSDPFVRNFSSFVPNRLQNQILFHKILYQLYILLAFMPETSPVLWALAYVDQK